eukprot:8305645-Lingulodinium_polyedra.AAC.1
MPGTVMAPCTAGPDPHQPEAWTWAPHAPHWWGEGPTTISITPRYQPASRNPAPLLGKRAASVHKGWGWSAPALEPPRGTIITLIISILMAMILVMIKMMMRLMIMAMILAMIKMIIMRWQCA